MQIEPDGLIDKELVKHTKLTIDNGEEVTFYVDKKKGPETLDRYYVSTNGSLIYQDTLNTINLGHSEEDHLFIKQLFNKLDNIIDLDFSEMNHNNGSMIDIYHISYSSNFETNVIGQAITQKTTSGGWWDIFWKDSPLTGLINKDNDHNTIIHEIGHSLGLGHPFNNPKDKEYTTEDTIMSYNRGSLGWDTWFSKNDINALIKIWGREDDSGVISYEQDSKNYKFKKDAIGNYYIKTEIGYEKINNIEALNFKDKSLKVQEDIYDVFDSITGIDDISGKVYRLYNSAFSRFPDKQGLNYWIQKNEEGKDSYRKTAESFILSKEFKELYGDNIDDNQFITQLYKNVLGRVEDKEGFNYWRNQLVNKIESRSELLIGFSESDEHKLLFTQETGIS
tara:strand:- start:5009 stop:6187 length:1179 start_codon:yes stop_codon:yes gene_type:complete